jgi:hypothetical protein
MPRKKHVITIPGYDYDKDKGWVDKEIESELNDDESLAGYSMPITEKMRDHMVELYREFLYKTFKTKEEAEAQTVYYTFGKEALMLILSQVDCDGITFYLGVNDKDDTHKYNTLIASGSKVRKDDKGQPATKGGKIIIEPIKKSDLAAPPPRLYEVVPPATLAQV